MITFGRSEGILSKMAPQGRKGGREIEAAKRSLALARKWTKSAADALESAQSQLRAAQDEEEEAESFLESVGKRWGVIDVGLEGGDSPAKPSTREDDRKRQRSKFVTPTRWW